MLFLRDLLIGVVNSVILVKGNQKSTCSIIQRVQATRAIQGREARKWKLARTQGRVANFLSQMQVSNRWHWPIMGTSKLVQG